MSLEPELPRYGTPSSNFPHLSSLFTPHSICIFRMNSLSLPWVTPHAPLPVVLITHSASVAPSSLYIIPNSIQSGSSHRLTQPSSFRILFFHLATATPGQSGNVLAPSLYLTHRVTQLPYQPVEPCRPRTGQTWLIFEVIFT